MTDIFNLLSECFKVIFNLLSECFKVIGDTFVYLLSFPSFSIFLFIFFFCVFIVSLHYFLTNDEDKDDEPEECLTYLNGDKYDG